jgi:hypothetical protein
MTTEIQSFLRLRERFDRQVLPYIGLRRYECHSLHLNPVNIVVFIPSGLPFSTVAPISNRSFNMTRLHRQFTVLSISSKLIRVPLGLFSHTVDHFPSDSSCSQYPFPIDMATSPFFFVPIPPRSLTLYNLRYTPSIFLQFDAE